MRLRNRYLEALTENYNVVGLASALSISAALVNPLPLLFALVAEVAYLAFVPDSKWYESRLSQRFDAEVLQRREALKSQILPRLDTDMQQRFLRLEAMRQEIHTQGEGQTWFREVVRKLDFLLEKFLHFATKDVQFRAYLETVRQEECGGGIVRPPAESGKSVEVWVNENLMAREGKWSASNPTRSRGAAPPGSTALPGSAALPRGAAASAIPQRDGRDRWIHATVTQIQGAYDADLNAVRDELAAEQDANTKNVLEKRVEVLQRRREFIGKIGSILTNLNHQLMLLEDTFGLINDEIRAHPPEQVLADIEDVVSQTNSMTALLDEMAPFEAALGAAATAHGP